jgi:predicted amidophosphoribosyltransferase
MLREYGGMAMAEALKCPGCGADTEPDARQCPKCQRYLKSELECLRSIDASVGIIKRILIWWVVVAFLVAAVYLINRFR